MSADAFDWYAAMDECCAERDATIERLTAEIAVLREALALLSEGVACPTCEGSGHDLACSINGHEPHCATCNGKGRLRP